MPYRQTMNYNVLYIYTIHDEAHAGKIKIGKTTLDSIKSPAQLPPNCEDIQKVSHDRIKQQTHTAMVEYELLHCELAIRDIKLSDGTIMLAPFADDDIHEVLKNSGYHPEVFRENGRDSEWFKIDLYIAFKAIDDFKNGHIVITDNMSKILPSGPAEKQITLRDEQAACVKKPRKFSKLKTKCFGTAKCVLAKRSQHTNLLKK